MYAVLKHQVHRNSTAKRWIASRLELQSGVRHWPARIIGFLICPRRGRLLLVQGRAMLSADSRKNFVVGATKEEDPTFDSNTPETVDLANDLIGLMPPAEIAKRPRQCETTLARFYILASAASRFSCISSAITVEALKMRFQLQGDASAGAYMYQRVSMYCRYIRTIASPPNRKLEISALAVAFSSLMQLFYMIILSLSLSLSLCRCMMHLSDEETMWFFIEIDACISVDRQLRSLYDWARACILFP